jgi:hypothetical protein
MHVLSYSFILFAFTAIMIMGILSWQISKPEVMGSSATNKNSLLASSLPRLNTPADNGQEISPIDGGNVILVSQRYNEEFSNEIVGEAKNNGNETAELVKVTVTLYDDMGSIIGAEDAYTDPSYLEPGMKALFKVSIRSGSLMDDTEAYRIALSWDNPDGSSGFNIVTGLVSKQTKDGGGEEENEDGDED